MSSPANFQVSRWSGTRKRLHEMTVGQIEEFAEDQKDNVHTSITRLEEAYGHERHYATHHLKSGWQVIRLK